MEPSLIPLDLFCSSHPNDKIQRVKADDGSLYCLECVLSSNIESKEELLTPEKFFALYENEKVAHLGTSIPESIATFIEKHTALIEGASQNIEASKAKAFSLLESIRNCPSDKIEDAKVRITKYLDDEFIYLQSAFKNYKTCVNSYFRSNQEENPIIQEETKRKIKESSSAIELEEICKEIATRARILKSKDCMRDDEILEELKFRRLHLEGMIQTHPTVYVYSKSYNKNMDDLFDEVIEFKHKYLFLNEPLAISSQDQFFTSLGLDFPAIEYPNQCKTIIMAIQMIQGGSKYSYTMITDVENNDYVFLSDENDKVTIVDMKKRSSKKIEKKCADLNGIFRKSSTADPSKELFYFSNVEMNVSDKWVKIKEARVFMGKQEFKNKMNY